MRFVLYNSTSRGTGGFVRALKIAGILTEVLPDAHCYVLAGNGAVPRPLPLRTEIVPLPKVSRAVDGRYLSPDRNVEAAFARRRTEIRDTIERVSPVALLIDSRPAGLRGELRDLLTELPRRTSCRVILLLRDIVDDTNLVKARWREERLYELLDQAYSDILVFGEESSHDIVSACGLEALADRVVYLGYLGAAQAPPQPPPWGPSPPRILATVGGGYDGEQILRAVVECASRPELASGACYTVVRGCRSPLAPADLLSEYTGQRPPITEIGHVERLETLVSEASLVISMCGYNTLYELIEARKKVIAVPRAHPGREQVMRAAALGTAYDGIWVLPHESLTAITLGYAIQAALAAPPPSAVFPMRGALSLGAFARRVFCTEPGKQSVETEARLEAPARVQPSSPGSARDT